MKLYLFILKAHVRKSAFSNHRYPEEFLGFQNSFTSKTVSVLQRKSHTIMYNFEATVFKNKLTVVQFIEHIHLLVLVALCRNLHLKNAFKNMQVMLNIGFLLLINCNSKESEGTYGELSFWANSTWVFKLNEFKTL